MLSTQVSEGAAGRAGFTRVDLIVTVVLALALAGGAWALVPGERMRGAMCAHHLGSLGKSVHQYARAREGGLPAAGVNLDKVQTTWDLELAPYLDGGSGKDDSGEAARKAQRHFLCPSDKMTHSGVARSYAMSGHDMSPLNWPAGAQAVSGVGLKWDKAAVLTLKLLNPGADWSMLSKLDPVRWRPNVGWRPPAPTRCRWPTISPTIFRISAGSSLASPIALRRWTSPSSTSSSRRPTRGAPSPRSPCRSR